MVQLNKIKHMTFSADTYENCFPLCKKSSLQIMCDPMVWNCYDYVIYRGLMIVVSYVFGVS